MSTIPANKIINQDDNVSNTSAINSTRYKLQRAYNYVPDPACSIEKVRTSN